MSETFADHATTEPTETPQADQAQGIKVGERSFNSVDDLAKSWENAQAHIRTLESERAQDKEALAQAKGVDSLLEKLQGEAASSDVKTDNTKAVNENGEYLTKEALEEVLAQREIKAQQERNVNDALGRAKAHYGDNAMEKLSNKAKELGMTESDALALAKTSPDAFANLFVPNAPKPKTTLGSEINSSAIRQPDAPKPSARVEIGAGHTDLLAAWNAAKPQLEE